MIVVYSVIFKSELRAEDPEYDAVVSQLRSIAETVPGFRSIDTVQNGLHEITISYWDSAEAIATWRQHPEHLDAQARGRAVWYARYSIRVAKIEREMHWERDVE